MQNLLTDQDLVPGDFVRHPGQPDWGRGQVQSVVGSRVTINFEHVGKLLIDTSVVELKRVSGDDSPENSN